YPSTPCKAVSVAVAGDVLPGDEPDRHGVLGVLLRLEPDSGDGPQERRHGAEHAPTLQPPIDARQFLGGPGGVLSAVLGSAPSLAVESRGGREFLPHPDSGVAGRQLEVHLGAAGTARSARAAPHDSSPAAWCDDALPGGHADAGWLGGTGTSGDRAAHSRDAGARDSGSDRGN